MLLAVTLVLAVLGAGCGREVTPAQDGEVDVTKPAKLVATVWTYDLAKVADNLQRFEQWSRARPDVPPTTIEMSDFPFGTYEAALTTRFLGGARVHVLRGSDHWLSKWATAGFVVPIEDFDPELRRYIDDMDDFVKPGVLYDGKLYGLLYYGDHMQFVYNTEILKRAGIERPPQTWDEVLAQGAKLKAAGVVRDVFALPLVLSPWLEEVFYALVYSQGGRLFDDQGNPTFGEGKTGPPLDMLRWLVDAIHVHGIVPAKTLEMRVVDVQEVFKAGDAAFVIVPSYMLAEFQKPGVSKVAGQAQLAMMPGTHHGTAGFARTYHFGRALLNEPKHVQLAAVKLIQFLGGQVEIDGVTAYHIPKRWAIENGLGFGYKSMWEDPDIVRVIQGWGDIDVLREQRRLASHKEGIEYPWYAEWVSFFQAELHKALMRTRTPEDVLSDAAKRWLKLKAEFER